VQVQGEEAAKQISYALDFINRHKAADVIILARGGGSLEELWPFNEEIVARSIYRSEIPVISAVGHETDFSISDFVADLRAPTPSAAAELVIPDKEILVKNIMDLRLRLKKSIINRIQCERLKLDQLMKSPAMRHPLDRINQRKMDLEILSKRMADVMKRRIEKEKGNLSVLCGKLDALSPLTVLARGYSITMKDGNIIKSVKQVQNGDKLDIILSDGKIRCLAEAADQNI